MELYRISALQPAATRGGPLLRISLPYCCAAARSNPLRPAAAHLVSIFLRCSLQHPAARCCASRYPISALQPAATRCGPLQRVACAYFCAAARSYPLRSLAAARGAIALQRRRPRLPAVGGLLHTERYRSLVRQLEWGPAHTCTRALHLPVRLNRARANDPWGDSVTATPHFAGISSRLLLTLAGDPPACAPRSPARGQSVWPRAAVPGPSLPRRPVPVRGRHPGKRVPGGDAVTATPCAGIPSRFLLTFAGDPLSCAPRSPFAGNPFGRASRSPVSSFPDDLSQSRDVTQACAHAVPVGGTRGSRRPVPLRGRLPGKRVPVGVSPR